MTRQYKDPQRQTGAYYQVSYTHRMKSRTAYVRAIFVKEVGQQISDYNKLKQRIERWVALGIEHSQLSMRLRSRLEMIPKGKPTTLRNKQRTAAQDAIDEDLEDLLHRSEQVLFEVLDALEHASVDPLETTILWADGAHLSIEESARRIHAQSGMPLDCIQSHVVGWLEILTNPAASTNSRWKSSSYS